MRESHPARVCSLEISLYKNKYVRTTFTLPFHIILELLVSVAVPQAFVPADSSHTRKAKAVACTEYPAVDHTHVAFHLWNIRAHRSNRGSNETPIVCSNSDKTGAVMQFEMIRGDVMP